MGTPNKPLNVRLNADLHARFDRLSEAMPGLPRSQLLRLLLAASLNGSLEEQVERVTGQIVNTKSLAKSEPRNRMNSSHKGRSSET